MVNGDGLDHVQKIVPAPVKVVANLQAAPAPVLTPSSTPVSTPTPPEPVEAKQKKKKVKPVSNAPGGKSSIIP